MPSLLKLSEKLRLRETEAGEKTTFAPNLRRGYDQHFTRSAGDISDSLEERREKILSSPVVTLRGKNRDPISTEGFKISFFTGAEIALGLVIMSPD